MSLRGRKLFGAGPMLGILFLLAVSASASMFEVQAGAHFRQEEDPGRETAVTCTLPGGGKLRLVNESCDEFFYGDDLRWGLSGGFDLTLAGLGIFAAGGVSLANSRIEQNQLSMDLFIRVSFWRVFLETEHCFYQDGLHAKHLLALAWPIPIGPTVLSPMLGAGAYLNTDYIHALYPILPFAGVRCEF